MKLKSKEVAAIKSYLKNISSELDDDWDISYNTTTNINNYISLIWDILDRNNDKDNTENFESSN